jgi:hypothetical protein
VKAIRAVLVAQMDRETGSLGLCLEGMRAPDGEVNSATEGLLIAHDLIEHVNGAEEIGSIDDELEALGAIWFVRGQFNDLSRDRRGSFYSVEENIASDVIRMFRDHWDGAQYVNTKRRYTRPLEDMHQDALNGILEFAQRDYRKELSDTDLTGVGAAWRAYKSAALHRMRTGFRKAQRKWAKNGGARAANRAFWEIADAVGPYAQRPEFEGMRYELTWTRTNGAYCGEIYNDDELE